MSFDADSSYSRLPAGVASRMPKPASRTKATATKGQKVIELTLFAVFGFTIALAGVALYATNRPEHQLVPNRVAAGLKADRVNVLLIGASLRPNGSETSGVRTGQRDRLGSSHHCSSPNR